MEPGVEPREAQPEEEGGRQPEWEPGQDQRVVPERGLMEGGRRAWDAGQESLPHPPSARSAQSEARSGGRAGLDLQRLES